MKKPGLDNKDRFVVIMAGATANLAPDSSAEVKNDNRADLHEIVLKKGSGEINRGGEVVSLSNFDKVVA